LGARDEDADDVELIVMMVVVAVDFGCVSRVAERQ